MPIIPLGQAEYNNEENRNLIDVYNDNFRQLDWLLNKIKLDSENLQTKIQFSETEINNLKQSLLNQVSTDKLTEQFIIDTQKSLQVALGDLSIQLANAQNQFYQLATEVFSMLQQTDAYIKNELNNVIEKANDDKKTIEEQVMELLNASGNNMVDFEAKLKELLDTSSSDLSELEKNILELIVKSEGDYTTLREKIRELMSESKDELINLTNDINSLLTNANDTSSELNRLLLLADATSNPLYDLIDKLENMNGNIDVLTPQQKEIIGNLAEIFNKGMFDTLGMNAKYLKFYPNRAYNSSFECFDETTLIPYYWGTFGTVSRDSLYADSYSLKLSKNQFARHENTFFNGEHDFTRSIASRQGLVDVSWWSSWCQRTRISFRAKTTSLNNPNNVNGKVYVECFAVDNAGAYLSLLTPYVWEGNVEKRITGDGHTQEVALEWIDGLVSVAFHHPISRNIKRVKFLIRNVGEPDIFIDAVQIEPDFTGKWASFYSDGLESTPSLTSIADNSITTSKVIDNAITTNKIIDNAITEAKLSSEVRTKINQASSVISDNSVEARHIKDNAITTSKITNNSITEQKLDVTLMNKINGANSIARFG